MAIEHSEIILNTLPATRVQIAEMTGLTEATIRNVMRKYLRPAGKPFLCHICHWDYNEETNRQQAVYAKGPGRDAERSAITPEEWAQIKRDQRAATKNEIKQATATDEMIQRVTRVKAHPFSQLFYRG
jgi:hypothetical protein